MITETLKATAAQFLANPDNNPEMPEKTAMTIAPIGQVMVSKQVISLQCAIHNSYGTYVAIQDVLAEAYQEMRDDFSQRSFNIMYDDLIKTKSQEAIHDL